VPLIILAALVGAHGTLLVGILYLGSIALYAPLTMARQGPRNGQTLGKQWLNLRVIHLSGQDMTIGRVDLPRFGGHGVVRRLGPLMLTCISSC
jgi:uncharacterized RDD family membrane protein YckC